MFDMSNINMFMNVCTICQVSQTPLIRHGFGDFFSGDVDFKKQGPEMNTSMNSLIQRGVSATPESNKR